MQSVILYDRTVYVTGDKKGQVSLLDNLTVKSHGLPSLNSCWQEEQIFLTLNQAEFLPARLLSDAQFGICFEEPAGVSSNSVTI